MKFSPRLQARIVPVATERGTRYAVMMNGETKHEDDFWCGALIWCARYGIEVVR